MGIYSIDENPEFLKLEDENKKLRKHLECLARSFSKYYDLFHEINKKYQGLVNACDRFFNKKEDNFIDRCFIDNCINEQKLSQQIKEEEEIK